MGMHWAEMDFKVMDCGLYNRLNCIISLYYIIIAKLGTVSCIISRKPSLCIALGRFDSSYQTSFKCNNVRVAKSQFFYAEQLFETKFYTH